MFRALTQIASLMFARMCELIGFLHNNAETKYNRIWMEILMQIDANFSCFIKKSREFNNLVNKKLKFGEGVLLLPLQALFLHRFRFICVHFSHLIWNSKISLNFNRKAPAFGLKKQEKRAPLL